VKIFHRPRAPGLAGFPSISSSTCTEREPSVTGFYELDALSLSLSVKQN